MRCDVCFADPAVSSKLKALDSTLATQRSFTSMFQTLEDGFERSQRDPQSIAFKV